MSSNATDATPIEPAPSALAPESLSESVVILLVLTIVQRAIGFVRSVLFCDWLATPESAEMLGQWDMAFGFLMMAAPLAVLGLPGSFGRYVEHYRQRDQLRTYLRRTAMTTVVMMIVAMTAMWAAPEWFAYQVFGKSTFAGLVPALSLTLAVVIPYNYLVSLLIALRRNRIVSLMQFSNTVAFAIVGSALLLWYSTSTLSVIIAFGISYFVGIVLSLRWMWGIWRAVPPSTEPLPHSTMWSRLAPYAFWTWLTNWLSNMFEIVDRYLLVHYSGLNDAAALNLVGQYAGARLVPALMIGVAELLGAVITPHLSSDWEAGRRRHVSHRLSMILKLFGMAMMAGSIAALFAAPLLFELKFHGKYAEGEAIMPWALMYCIWTSLSVVAFNYLWCAEKSRLVTFTLIVGLALNVLLNLALLPSYWLWGAVISTSIAKAVALVMLGVLLVKNGMRMDRGLMIVACLPMLLPMGPWVALVVAGIVVAGLVPGVHILNRAERVRIGRAIGRMRARGGWA